MLFQPKKFKHKKLHRRQLKQVTARNTLEFGVFGLQALDSGVLTSQMLEKIRLMLVRRLKKTAFIWFRIFPQIPITKKPSEVRMGKGKGSVAGWVAPIPRGKILVEVSGSNSFLIRKALLAVRKKLSIVTKLKTRSL